MPLDHTTELIRHLEGLRQRIDALDVAATGICAGMRLNTLGGEAAYQALDLIAVDLRAKADAALRLAAAVPLHAVATPPASAAWPAAAAARYPGNPPMPASSAGAR